MFVVLMDATYWGRRFGVVIMKDHISGLCYGISSLTRKKQLQITEKVFSYLELHGYMF